MTKPRMVGHTARNGLFAALLAREGSTANPAELDTQDRLLCWCSMGPGHLGSRGFILRDGESPYDIVRTGLRGKSSNQMLAGRQGTPSAIDAMLVARRAG